MITPGPWRLALVATGVLATELLCPRAGAAALPGAARFRKEAQPILMQYCSDCHADGMNKGGVAFDAFKSDQALLEDRDLWLNALKYLRAGLMPPAGKPRPSEAEKQRVVKWIKTAPFGIDLRNPDPGRITVRRLNRVEYRNSIRDLLGVDFDTSVEFPPDDTGYGFDNIGDVLSLSPMLFEKYIAAAKKVVAQAVPGEKEKSTKPAAYHRYFPKEVPDGAAERRQYAREILGSFARKAFRRSLDSRTLERLTALAESVYAQQGKTFEEGIAHSLEAVIASPRFLFRLEENLPAAGSAAWSPVDEYSLASRLSYFLWSTTPDEQLLQLAERGELRKNLAAQVKRMLEDQRSEALVRDFTGQWLQTRDLEGSVIDARVVLARDNGQERQLRERKEALRAERNAPVAHLQHTNTHAVGEENRLAGPFRLGRPAFQLDREVKQAMRSETEMFFASVMREERDVAELIDGHYTFLNEKLASLYGLTNLEVSGPELRRVELPAGCARGGILTLGSVLAVTSNPDRTSPVKRGLFVLSNVLGTPPPPPPPNIPALEASEKDAKEKGQEPTLRATLEVHRNQPLCASCHNRMDPIGLGLENFNALGMWRDKERGQPIEPAGKLITGESFCNVQELKHILANEHRGDFYRCLTEKLLTYALGRGLEYYDVETVDEIVQRVERSKGHFSALLAGIVESAPFQKRRIEANAIFSEPPPTAEKKVSTRTPEERSAL